MADAMDGDDSRSSTPGDGLNQSTPPPAEPGSASEAREDQMQNAVSFLSHPKVRGSPKASKVSFLRQKGLTEAEIEEAFRRVPETPVPALPTTTQQPKSTLPTTVNHVAPQQQQHYAQNDTQPIAMQQQQQQQPVRWSQVALGAGFAAASAYAVKSLVWPFVADKYTAWRGTSSISPQNRNDLAGSAAGSSDVNAVADAIRAQTAELASSIEALKALVAGLDKERPASPEDKVTASEIRQELHTIAASLNEIVASPRPIATTAVGGGGPSSLSLETELSEIKNLLSEYLETPRSGEHTPPGELNRTTPTPGSFSSAQDQPHSEAPSPIQLGDNKTNNANGNTSNAFTPTRSTVINPTTTTTTTTNTLNTRTKDESGHPASYMEVLEMLERGETPPGIRDDINDKPPNPEQAPPQSMMKPLPKPWEQRQQKQEDGNGGGDVLYGSGMAPISQDFSTEALTENGSGAINLSPVLPDDALQSSGSAQAIPISSPSPSPSPTRTNQQQQQRQQQLPGSGNNPASPLTAAGSKGATSIFEAATSSQGSPGVIAGRLSPSSDQRKGTNGDDGGGRGLGVAIPTSLFSEQYTENATSTTNGEEEKHDRAAGDGRPPRLTTTTPAFPDEGGLGRPTSRGWRPPPIPVPTLSENTSNPALGAGALGGGASGSATSGSQKSLGADFAAA